MAKKEKNTIHKVMLLFLLIAFLLSGFTIYEIFLFQGIETFIRYVIIGLIFVYDIHLFFKYRKIVKGKTKKKPHKKLFVFWLILYSILCFGIAFVLNYVYSKVDSVHKSFVTYTSYLVVMEKSPIQDIQDAKDLVIGIYDDKKNPDGYIIPQEMIQKYKLQDSNEIRDYGDYGSMLADLYADEVDAIFLPGGYVASFSSITGYENIETDTKVIGKASRKMKKADVSTVETASSGKSVTEPFTILLMGIDSTDEVLEKNAVANGDTLILVTFNPKTLNATMISIPRDSYVPISCWSGKPENKITHAAAYGNDCMIHTIEDYFDVPIDYYAKINFKGLVKLVDAVGGVTVNVPQTLCADDSSRYGQLCINAGRQTLNGEQALVFARDRYDLADGDFGRARHQQEIIMAIVDKMKDVKDVKTFMSIFDTVSNSIDTNLTTKQILSFYNVGKDIIKKSLSSDDADLVNIQQLYLQGTGQTIYDERARMALWDYIPNKSSRNDIVDAMKQNLELKDHKVIKEFHFSINTPYEKKVIGEGPYSNTTTYRLLPDFTGDTTEEAKATCASLGITCTFDGTKGTVVSQSEPFRKRLDLMKNGVVLTLSGDKDKNKDKDKDKEKEDSDEEEEPGEEENENSSSGGSGTGTDPEEVEKP